MFFPDSHCHKGFTLLELMVVMALLGIISGFILPKVHNTLLADHLKSTARHLAAMAGEAGIEALRQRQTALLHIDPDKGEIWYEIQGGSTKKQEKNVINIPESVRITAVISRHGGDSPPGDMQISFSAKGYVDETLIRLRDDEREVTIMLSAFLGVVKVYDGHIDFRQ